MVQYGTGTGTPATPAVPAPTGTVGVVSGAISLARYASRIGYAECAFFGVQHPDNQNWACRQIWTKDERDAVAWALAEAQAQIEQVLGYYLAPTWITGERHRWSEQIILDKGCVIAGGIASTTLIAAGVAIDDSVDPATVTVDIGTCDASNVKVVHAGTQIAIEPSVLSSTDPLVIYIPWCRLVHPDYQDNPPEGLDYNDHGTWMQTAVDIYCVANDTSSQACIVWRATECALPDCTDTRVTGCIYVRDDHLSIVDVVRADYADGVWTRRALTSCPDWATFNYYSGLESLPSLAEDMIIRLAHSLMPAEPCGCDVTQRLWKRDRNVPSILTAERLNCMFGMSDGAWVAWQYALANAIQGGGMF